MIYLIIFLPERGWGEGFTSMGKITIHPTGSLSKPSDKQSGEEKPEGKQVNKIPCFLEETLVGAS